MPSKLPILVLQYSISGHVRRTEHWSLAVITDIQTSSARIFEVQGNMDSFTFESKDVRNISSSKSFCGGVQVGEVNVKELVSLEAWLKLIRGEAERPALGLPGLGHGRVTRVENG